MYLIIKLSGNGLPNQSVHLFHNYVGIPVWGDGAPVVKVIGKLPVAATEEVGLQMDPGKAVVSAGPLVSAREFWNASMS